ncbi:MAG TPA: GFA family protein [Dongiaceae bacterium]|jgi:hypothetical protein|nr:GFA family protein [Dongiaceae bacterium]
MITGGCLCGAVRFTASEKPISARVCWCRFCQRLGAGGGTVNAAFKTDAVKIEGTLADYASTADSGNRMHRRFCPKCGTHLFSEAEARPHLIFVRAGALDDPEVAKPVATIWAASAPSWAAIDPSLPRIEGQPPPVA